MTHKLEDLKALINSAFLIKEQAEITHPYYQIDYIYEELVSKNLPVHFTSLTMLESIEECYFSNEYLKTPYNKYFNKL